MSYPDPPGQPHWQPSGPQYPPGASAPPPAGHGFPPQGPPPGPPYGPPQGPAPRRNRVWMIPVAAGLGVLLMASGVWAANTVVTRLFGGPQPETVLPSDSVAFMRLDLKPSGAKLTDYASFMGKLPDSVKDEVGDDEDPGAALFDEIIEASEADLDYEEDIEPWLGGRFGVALWKSETEGGEPGLVAGAAVAATDEAAAEDAVKELTAGDGTAGEVRDGFAFFADSGDALDEMYERVEDDGSLAENETYAADMAGVADDSLAAGWYDLGATSDLLQEELSSGGSSYGGDPWDDGYGDYGSSGPDFEGMEFGGRVAAAVSIESDYAELRADVIDFTMGDFALADYETTQTGLTEMAELPDDTSVALGGSGLDELSAQSWDDMAGVMPDEMAEVEAGLDEMGISVPDGFGDLLGTQTAVGLSDLQSGLDDPFSDFDSGSVQYRAVGADQGLIDDLVTQASEGSYSSPPGVDSDGDTVVVSSGSTGQGRLGDDPIYQQVMEGSDSAFYGMYMDLRSFAESGGESDADQWGAFGIASAIDGERVTSHMRWAPSGE